MEKNYFEKAPKTEAVENMNAAEIEAWNRTQDRIGARLKQKEVMEKQIEDLKERIARLKDRGPYRGSRDQDVPELVIDRKRGTIRRI
jgi:chromosome segregation ATPase